MREEFIRKLGPNKIYKASSNQFHGVRLGPFLVICISFAKPMLIYFVTLSPKGNWCMATNSVSFFLPSNKSHTEDTPSWIFPRRICCNPSNPTTAFSKHQGIRMHNDIHWKGRAPIDCQREIVLSHSIIPHPNQEQSHLSFTASKRVPQDEKSMNHWKIASAIQCTRPSEQCHPHISNIIFKNRQCTL